MKIDEATGAGVALSHCRYRTCGLAYWSDIFNNLLIHVQSEHFSER
jgi:hypothetical protein